MKEYMPSPVVKLKVCPNCKGRTFAKNSVCHACNYSFNKNEICNIMPDFCKR